MLNGFKSPGRIALIGDKSDIGRSIIDQLLVNKKAEVIDVGLTGKFALDVTDKSGREAIVEKIFATGDLDLAIIAVGLLGKDPKLSEADNLVAMMDVNYLSTVHLLKLISDRMKNQAHGMILVISSFAQVRPRDDNFGYGSTKAALDFYARGLSSKLKGTGVTIRILRPGFVTSKMTAGLTSPPFTISTEECGRYGVQALKSRKLVTWAPSILKYVAILFKALPQTTFRKISQR
jgi:decaprenylphospho-beta-D-erythro-pentofuranosid-2-ulose 2-reductase